MADRIRRTKQFAIRLSDDERARVDRLCDHYGLDVASLLRMVVKKEYDIVVMRHKNSGQFHHSESGQMHGGSFSDCSKCSP